LRLIGDDRLARRVANGDTRAFATLYERHHQAIYRYCRAILGNSEDAADALQNTMMAALRALSVERRDIRLKPWLYKIAHNEAISLVRQRRPQVNLEEALDVAAPSGSDPATRERLRQLVADLRQLPDRQRSALVMRELSGLEYGEIGAALGSSPAATKQTVYEARAALHEMAEGRDMSCDAVRRSLSAEDRRLLRGRKLRAHLRACAGCREFQAVIDTRQRDLACVAPPLPLAAAAAMLHGMTGGGSSGGAGGLAGLAGGGTGKAVATSVAAKGLATVAVVATVGAGTAGLAGKLPGQGRHHKPAQSAAPSAGGSRAAGTAAHSPGAIPSRATKHHRPAVSGPRRANGRVGRHATRPHPSGRGLGVGLGAQHGPRTSPPSRSRATPQRSSRARTGKGRKGAGSHRRAQVSPRTGAVPADIEPSNPAVRAPDAPASP
jgi:RNA polymerase sigma factor (sigma-70 family)